MLNAYYIILLLPDSLRYPDLGKDSVGCRLKMLLLTLYWSI